MTGVPEAAVSAVARAGSFLALAAALWYGCLATGLPFAAFLLLFAVAAVLALHGSGPPEEPEGQRLPLLPLLVVLAIVLSPVALSLDAASGPAPHWFRDADDGFMVLIARGLERAFPPPDLSWEGQPLRYHLGEGILVDLLRRASGFTAHAVHYALLPVLMRLILTATMLVLVRRIAPSVPPRWRVWMPLAVGALPTIDLFNLVWHSHDFWARGLQALDARGSPVVSLRAGLLSAVTYDNATLALAFTLVLIATWRNASWIEKATLLFAVYLAKSQVFLAVGMGYGLFALLRLRRRDWKPAVGGVIALGAAVATLPLTSTYGSMARITVGCGHLCREFLSGHGLEGRLPAPVILTGEALLFLASFHLLGLLALLSLRRLRQGRDPELAISALIAGSGLVIGSLLRLQSSTELRARFTAVYQPIAGHLFLPLHEYLDRIMDLSASVPLSAFASIVPIIGMILLVDSIPRVRRLNLSRAARWTAVLLLVAGAYGSSAAHSRLDLRMAKRISPDTLRVLNAIPSGGGSVLTNDLAWDDTFERHLPLLDVWAPAVSGRQFWASSFMFTFQHPDAGQRLQRVRWFFGSQATPGARLRFTRDTEIEFVLLRRDLPHGFDGQGWTRLIESGRYALYRRSAAP